MKTGPTKIGDEWTEAVNEKRAVGSLELTTNGQIKYKLTGLKPLWAGIAQKYLESQLSPYVIGTVVEGEGQQQTVNLLFDTSLEWICLF